MKRFIIKFLVDHFLFIKTKKYDLIIIDDLLPISFSPWRNFEFNSTLEKYNKSLLIADLTTFNSFKGNKDFDAHLKELNDIYPLLASKLLPLKVFTSLNSKLVYMIFYANIIRYYSNLKKFNLPYAFTLYPGGGFKLYDPVCENELKKIINDPLCKFVITTQKATHNYLIDQLKLPKDKLRFIFGVPLPPFKELELREDQKYYNGNKKIIDIVFMAHKYMPFGIDKGFDVFQNIAIELIQDTSFRFHVVGNFGTEDLIYSDLKDYIQFHGILNETQFTVFFEDKDIIISPNRPNALWKGAFDGFPLASSIAGGTNNCVMMLANELNESPDIFIDTIDYINIKPLHKDIIPKLLLLKSQPEYMKKLAVSGLNKIKEVYSPEFQVKNRLKIFQEFL